MYLLRLMGRFTLDGPSGPLSSRVVPQRRLALLALLGSGGDGGLSRDKLVALLWPERPDRAARHLLADAVYRVRKALREDAITSDGDTLRLNPAVIGVDVGNFRAALSRDDLETALELYEGPFLDGFHLSGASREFERWSDTERSRIEMEVEGALESLAERAEARGDLVQAVEWWRRLIARDPINTRIALRLMQALADAGDRANAIQLAQKHEHSLLNELGVEPPPELQALVEKLRRPPEPGPPSPLAERRPGVREPPFSARRAQAPTDQLPITFVSRDSEMTRLTEFLQAALAGQGRVGVVTGEAGTGKTALAEEYCRRAMEGKADLIVATGKGNAHTGTGDPYHLFRDIFGLLTGDVEAPWAAGSLSRDHAKRLWNLLPATANALVDVGRDLIGTFVPASALLNRAVAYGAVDSTWRVGLTRLLEARGELPETPPTQVALFDQCKRVLRAVARERPLLLVLDDLQWADAGSLDLLFQLGRDLHGSRILILGLYRPSEVALGRDGERHPLATVINELVRRYGDIEVPLTEEHDVGFVDAIVDALPNRLDGDFREALFHHTRGHALFTVELLRGMQERGVLALDDDGRWTLAAEMDWQALPARVEAVIEERISRLPQGLERTLSVASVEGERFTLEVVAELMGSSVVELLPVFAEELERRHHLVRARGIRKAGEQTLSQYSFRHILFQKYLYDRLDTVEATHLHGQMGEALERLYGDRTHELTLPLARHFKKAGVTDKAAAYLCEAGLQAKGAAAYPEAVAHLQGAVELLRTLPESLDRDRGELQAQMALGLIWYGVEGHGFAEVEESFVRAKELSERLGDRAQQFWILGGFFAIRHYQARHNEGHDALSECLTLAQEDGNAGLLALCHTWLGINAFNRGRLAEALDHLDQVRALYDPEEHGPLLFGWLGGDPEPALEALRGLVLWSLGHPDQARERLEEARRSARELVGHTGTLNMVLNFDLILRMWLPEPEALARQNEALRSLAKEHGLPQELTLTTFFRGWCLSQEGKLERAVAVLDESLATLEAQGWAVWLPFYCAQLADAYRRTGQPELGLELINRGLATIQITDERIHEAEQHRLRGELLLALKTPDREEAEAAFHRAIEVAREQEAKSYELRATTSLARLLRDQGRTEQAHKELVGVYEWFTEGFDRPDLREAQALLDELSR